MPDMSQPHTLIGQTVDCACGRAHTIETQTCLYEADALIRLPDVMAQHSDGRDVLMFADKRTYRAAGHKAEAVLDDGGWRVRPVILSDPPICDDLTYVKLTRDLPGADMFLAVGGGVVSDLTKWISFDRKCPYVMVPTAASMNGYTSSGVSPAIKGVKVLAYAHVPVAVVTEPDIITYAPFELTAAGLGDAIAKPISTADWLMNHLLLGEYFCPAISQMITDIERQYFDNPEGVQALEPQAVKALYDALIYSGFAMTLVGTSAPASGGEHMFSHTLDMMAAAQGSEHDLHGREVGLGTIFAAALYEKLFELEEPVAKDMPKDIDRDFWGKMAGPVSEQYEAKKPLVATMRKKLPKPLAWKELLVALKAQGRPAGQIKECLRRAGAAHCGSDIGCDRQQLREVVLHMHEIRKRPTVVDLAWILGVLPGQADELIDEWLAQ